MQVINVRLLATVSDVANGVYEEVVDADTWSAYFTRWDLFLPGVTEEIEHATEMPNGVAKRLFEFSHAMGAAKLINGDVIIRWFRNTQGMTDAAASAQLKGNPGTEIVLARWHSDHVIAPTVEGMLAIVEARRQRWTLGVVLLGTVAGLLAGLLGGWIGFEPIPLVVGVPAVAGWLLASWFRLGENRKVDEAFKLSGTNHNHLLWALKS